MIRVDKLKFTKKSYLTKTWVSLIITGTYSIEDIPALGNLREVVEQVIVELENQGDN